MKKITFCFFILYLFSDMMVAQNNILRELSVYPKKNIAKVFYFGSGGGGYNLAFERLIRRKISIQLSLRYTNYRGGVFSFHSYNNIYLQPEARYYLSKYGAPKGFYLGINSYIEILKIVYKVDPPMNSIAREIFYGYYLGKEMHLGYQLIIRKRLSVDVNVGMRYINRIGPIHVVSYYTNGAETKKRTYADDNAGYFTPVSFLPSFSFLIGYAFGSKKSKGHTKKPPGSRFRKFKR